VNSIFVSAGIGSIGLVTSAYLIKT